MASLRAVLYLCVCLSAWIITADSNQAENVHWISLDFKTVLTWTTTVPGHMFNVFYSTADNDWQECPDCIRVTDTECDMTNCLSTEDRVFTADIQTEIEYDDQPEDPDVAPHTLSPTFNPYKQTQISAVNFTVKAVDENVTVTVIDPLTSIHRLGKQLTIRDIFKKDLMYKMSYHKSGSTGKKDFTFADNSVNVPKLDKGESYCFMVAAFIPTRAENDQLGAWSEQKCIQRNTNPLKELRLWVVIIFLLILLIIIIMVSVVCCRRYRKRNRPHQTAQRQSALIGGQAAKQQSLY